MQATQSISPVRRRFERVGELMVRDSVTGKLIEFASQQYREEYLVCWHLPVYRMSQEEIARIVCSLRGDIQ